MHVRIVIHHVWAAALGLVRPLTESSRLRSGRSSECSCGTKSGATQLKKGEEYKVQAGVGRKGATGSPPLLGTGSVGN